MRWIYVLIGGCLLLVLLGLVDKTRSINLPQGSAISAEIQKLQALDANWTTEVLRNKTGLSSNYDEVTKRHDALEALKDEIKLQIDAYWKNSPENLAKTSSSMQSFESQMKLKADLIEQFKSQNAILRNSTQFLHTGTSSLSNHIQNSSISEKQQIALERILNRVYSSTMTYLQNADPHRRDQIERSLLVLGDLAQPLPADLSDEAKVLITHVKEVMDQHENSAALLDEIIGMKTADAIQAIYTGNELGQNDLFKSLQFLQKALIFFSSGLVFVLIFMAYKIAMHYREIQSANEKLEEAYEKLKESQVHQVQTEKMSALGQMVAGIAHEINTPLAYLKATFNVIQEQLPQLQHVVDDSNALSVALRTKPDLDDLQPQVERVNQSSQAVIRGGLFTELGTLTQDGIHGVDQISEIVTNLKNFSRLDREKVTGFSVESGLDSTLLLARNLLKYTVTIVKDYGHVPSVLGAPSQINQVFLNLITNASHAMPQRSLDENIIQLRTRWVRDENMVLIEIEDNGNGIKPEHIGKIFDPFFTTKPIGQGTGMGLSISYKIIQEHGGRLEVKSQVGKGTTFSIWLPIERHNLAESLDPQHNASSHNALVD